LKFVLALAIVTIAPLQTHAQSTEEYRVKAAFLYHFATFVEWPAQIFRSSADPISICVLGQNRFGRLIEDTVAGKEVEGRGFVVLPIADMREAGACKVLFVSSSQRKSVRSILAEVKGSGILTVGEIDGFASEGGIVNFRLDQGKVRIEVNLQAADEGRLRISSKLLSLARIVKR
jgi:hypothetical protein